MRFSASILLMLILLGDKLFLQKKMQSIPAATADTTIILTDTVLADDKNLQEVNGIYYFHCAPFTGVIKEKYDDHLLKSLSSYVNGMQHGLVRSWYPNGQLSQVRCYKENKCDGIHRGWWENGVRKFEFAYKEDKREGVFRQWYRSGSRYTDLYFKNDREEGMQRAWRENGKLYLNYEVRDGVRYGLQKSALCYTLVKEKIKDR